jgi:hypothetical protein
MKRFEHKRVGEHKIKTIVCKWYKGAREALKSKT